MSVTAWVFGHQLTDLVGLMLHPILFFSWMYVLTLTPVPAWSYFTTLASVGFYTSGLGYLVSPFCGQHLAGTAVSSSLSCRSNLRSTACMPAGVRCRGYMLCRTCQNSAAYAVHRTSCKRQCHGMLSGLHFDT